MRSQKRRARQPAAQRKLSGKRVDKALQRRVGGSTGRAWRLAGLCVLLACLLGCSAPGGSAGKLGGPSLFSRRGESKAQKEALKKAVDKDPFPAAASKPINLGV
jgi:hypothetical protein